MPAPVTAIRTGTGWTIDVTSLALSSDVGVNDFRMYAPPPALLVGGVTKLTATTLQYTGTALPLNTTVKVFRYTPVSLAALNYREVNTSAGLNNRHTQLLRIIEDLRAILDTYTVL